MFLCVVFVCIYEKFCVPIYVHECSFAFINICYLHLIDKHKRTRTCSFCNELTQKKILFGKCS
ncbi:hypothetical protein HanIR_Chr12g0603401 [Helianthus annuus]|nr:hypothetical protein HanIR_Chr12g0603401 [Helianthus annuus]